MNGDTRTKTGVIYSIVADVILLIAVGIQCWTTTQVIQQGRTLASHATMLNINSERITNLEQVGSRSLGEHVHMDDIRVSDLTKRVEKVETAILVLQATPSRLDAVQASLSRIERVLEEHMKVSK